MGLRFLLDTHVALRLLIEPNRLSREQARVLDEAVRCRESVAISAITLLEVALLWREGRIRSKATLDDLLAELDRNPPFQVLPLTTAVVREVPALASVLRDPSDCVIAATARVHGLRLLTSDQRIIGSNVVSVVD